MFRILDPSLHSSRTLFAASLHPPRALSSHSGGSSFAYCFEHLFQNVIVFQPTALDRCTAMAKCGGMDEAIE